MDNSIWTFTCHEIEGGQSVAIDALANNMTIFSQISYMCNI